MSLFKLKCKELQIDRDKLTKLHTDALWGDKVEAWAKRVGAARAAEIFECLTKLPCGCKSRKAVLNWLDGAMSRVVKAFSE